MSGMHVLLKLLTNTQILLPKERKKQKSKNKRTTLIKPLNLKT